MIASKGVGSNGLTRKGHKQSFWADGSILYFNSGVVT